MANIPLVREITPKFTPLNAPVLPGRGPLRQSATPFQLKPLAQSDLATAARMAQPDEHADLTKQAQKLVAQAFYGPLIKQMHDSPFKASWVDGGRGGEAFQPLLDERLVDHMSRASGNKLVKSVVRKIEGGRTSFKGRKKHGAWQSSTLLQHLGDHVPPGLRA